VFKELSLAALSAAAIADNGVGVGFGKRIGRAARHSEKHMIALLPTIKDSTSVQVMVTIDSSTRKLLNQAPG